MQPPARTRAGGTRPSRLRGLLRAAFLGAFLGLCAACGSASDGPFDLDGAPVDPFGGSTAKALVLLFVGVDCPISNRYAPEVHRIHAEYGPRGVDMRLVYADATPETVRKHLVDYAYTLPALLDPELALVRRTGATVTPEAVVLTPDGETAYRGRIDDWYVDFGVARHEATTHELRDALDAVLAGEPVAVPNAPAVGCFLPRPE